MVLDNATVARLSKIITSTCNTVGKKMGFTPSTCEDAAQDVWIKISNGLLDRYDASLPLEPWLATVCVNRLCQMGKAEGYRATSPEDVGAAYVAPSAQRADVLSIILDNASALQRGLGAADHARLLTYLAPDYCEKQDAIDSDMSVGAVRVRKSRLIALALEILE